MDAYQAAADRFDRAAAAYRAAKEQAAQLLRDAEAECVAANAALAALESAPGIPLPQYR